MLMKEGWRLERIRKRQTRRLRAAPRRRLNELGETLWNEVFKATNNNQLVEERCW